MPQIALQDIHIDTLYWFFSGQSI